VWHQQLASSNGKSTGFYFKINNTHTLVG